MSVDQSVVDLDIPFRLGGFASTTIQLLGIVGVMSKVTWQVLLLFFPMAIACWWMQVINRIAHLLWSHLMSAKPLITAIICSSACFVEAPLNHPTPFCYIILFLW